MARQAATLTGAFIGAALGAPQLGFFIGSLVGNAIDPVRIKAPSIGDISQQTSTEGVACPLYAGTAGGAGNLVYCSAPDIVDGGTSSGKGSQQVEEPDRAYITFIIRVGASLFDGPGYRVGITSLIKVWEDEKLVYDVSPTSTILEESAKYAETFTFYPGDYTQLPDPDVEAIEGVGNVPAYRGRAIFVKKRYDCTDRKGTVPNFRFEVSVDGATANPVVLVSDSRHYSGSPADMTASPDSIGFSNAINMIRVSPDGRVVAGSTVDAIGGSDRFSLRAFDPVSRTWSAVTPPVIMPARGPRSMAWSPKFPDGSYRLAIGTVEATERLWVFRWDGTSLTKLDDPAESLPDGPSLWAMAWNENGTRLAVGNAASADSLYVWDFVADRLVNRRGLASPGTNFIGGAPYRLDWKVGKLACANGTAAFIVDTDPSEMPVLASAVFDVDTSVSQGCFWAADFEHVVVVDGDKVYTLVFDDVADTLTLLATDTILAATATDASIDPSRRYIAVAENGDIEVVYLGAADLPDPAVVDVVGATSASSVSFVATRLINQVAPGYTTFEQVTLATGRRCKLPDSIWNLPGLDAKVIRGTVVASQGYTAQDFLNSLRTVFPCDGATFDGKIHILLRGGAIDLELDDEFMVDEGSDLEQEEVLRNGDEKRQANLRRPARINVMFPNANVGYNLTKAMPPAFGDRGDAVSETSLQVPVVLDEATEAPQLADVLDKISRADAEGEIARIWPEYLAAKLVPGSLVRLVSGDLTRRTRVENIRRGDGTVRVLHRIDRAHAYGSLATAQPSPGWPAPPASLVGDTTAVFLNAPALVDDQDRLGVVAAISGYANTAWHGARIDYRVQGTTTWTTLGTYTTRAVIGTLLEDLPGASPYWPDWTNQVRVRLLHDDQIESLTDTEWLSELGAFAIRRADGTAEIIQARDAVAGEPQEWSLSMLQRGRLNTVSTTGHSLGTQVVFLDRSIFLPLPIALIGKTLEFRVTSLGASPETAPTFTLAWNPAVCQQEWTPMGLELERAGGTISGSFSPRHRFGTDVNPVPSGNVLGYRVTLTDGTTTQVLPDTTATTFSTSDAAFSGPITVTVQALNRYTGPGPGTSETV